ncbi:hypothetical protein HHI36_007715 [Cryptolaemus montrouzieri]|uniref:Uncharacterized protein n=1 Tax=Cryptolaemus montrouzieri TaxID=559131 RepID=A0ABD2MQT4_9CUCU
MSVIVCSGSKIPTNTNSKLKGATRRRWIYVGCISGKDVSVEDVFIHASFISTAVNGFEKRGIWPYNSSVFSENDFAPLLMTDIPQIEREREPITEVTNATITSNIG